MMELKKAVKVDSIFDLSEATDYIENKRIPFVLRNTNIGECKTKWSVDYLQEKIKDKDVKVHVAPINEMNFIKKNFIYRTLPFNDFIKRASQDTQTEFFIDKDEKYYLRSLGNDERKDIADLKKQYPEISDDINYPPLFNNAKYFSSVFRISSKELRLWTHYDIMDNMLIQINGIKKITFFKPSDIDYLYMIGDKSEIIDVENPDLTQYPLYLNAQRFETELNPGDVVFIPALWLHNVVCKTFSIGINVFWKHLADNLYDKQDLYGNKDLIPASKALDLTKRSVKELNSLPKEYKEFYIKRMIQILKENI